MSLFAAFTAEATEVKIKEVVDVDIDFNYVNSTADEVISEALLGANFALETQNVTVGNRVVEVKYFYRFIPVSFTQSELNEFMKEINNITNSSNPSTVIDDFRKIDVASSKLLSHGNDFSQSRSKRQCYIRRTFFGLLPAAGCETNPNRTLGIGVQVTPLGASVVVRYKQVRVPIPVNLILKAFGLGKRDAK